MRAVEPREAFGLEHLTLTERTDPSPGPREVLSRCSTSGCPVFASRPSG